VTYDLAVIGGGIIGACALRLAAEEHPEWKLLLLERALIGTGASRYSVGMELPFGINETRRRLSIESGEIFARWAPEIADLRRPRIPLFAIIGRDRVETITAGFHGAPLRPASTIEESRLRDVYPSLRFGGDQRLFTGSSASVAEVHRLAEDLVALSRAEVWESAEVESVANGRIALRDGRGVAARRIIAAPGPWVCGGPTARFAALHQIRIKRVAALHVDVEPARDTPVLFFFDEDAFLLPVHDERRFRFSFTSRHWDVTPELPRTLAIAPEDRAPAMEILDRYVPAMAPRASGGRVFCDSYAPDWRPVIASMPDDPEFVVATGCAGSGYRLGPAIARDALRLFDLIPVAEEAAHARPIA
jgi:glycine/D-amino acid oxidase-like deaminating enzyme